MTGCVIHNWFETKVGGRWGWMCEGCFVLLYGGNPNDWGVEDMIKGAEREEKMFENKTNPPTGNDTRE